MVVVLLLLLLGAAELLVEVFGAALEFVSMDTLASVTVGLLGSATNAKREPLTVGMLVVAADAIVVAVVLLLLVAAELLVEVLEAAVELVSIEMLASIIVELLGPAPNVKREPLMRKIVSQKIRVIMTTCGLN